MQMAIFGAIVLVASSIASALQAQDSSSYPSKAITMVVPFPPGAATSVAGRLIAQSLERRLGQTIVIDNKPGAGARLGAATVAKARPDGYTLLFTLGAPISIAPHLNVKLNYDPSNDLRPIARMVTAPNLLVVRKAFPAQTFSEFIAYAKKHPEKISFGLQGVGVEPHVTLEMLRRQADVRITAIPYGGGAPAILDLLAERIDAMFLLPAIIKEHLDSGQLRSLAILEPERLPEFPNVPTIAEVGFPKLTSSIWFGVFAPGGTPEVIVGRLAKELLAMRDEAALAERLRGLGFLLNPIGPAEFDAFLTEERHNFAGVAVGGRLDKPN